jgi:polyphosphate kinase 2 (PPK2 family)
LAEKSKDKSPNRPRSAALTNLSKKLKCKDFEKHLAKLQAELVKLQYWFEVSQKEKTKRFLDRISDGRKVALK